MKIDRGQAEVLFETQAVPPPVKHPYIVMAYYAPQEFWKVFPDLWETAEAAEKHAGQLRKGWLFRRVVKIVEQPK